MPEAGERQRLQFGTCGSVRATSGHELEAQERVWTREVEVGAIA